MLLLKDKVVINKITKNKIVPKINDSSEIIGKSKYVERHSMPITSSESQIKEVNDKGNNFEMKTKGQVLKHPIPEINSAENSEDTIDFEEEEEEFKKIGLPNRHRGYAKGVTFQELNKAGQLLQQKELEPVSVHKAVVIVRKIEGTDLFKLLENSIDGASRKIADLLNKNLPNEPNPKNLGNSDDFDIGEFI